MLSSLPYALVSPSTAVDCRPTAIDPHQDTGNRARGLYRQVAGSRLTAQQSSDLYELVIERHRRASFVLTSNRAVDEWLGLFDDPILGNSALDRLANAAHHLVLDGPSYRARLAPKRREQRDTSQEASR